MPPNPPRSASQPTRTVDLQSDLIRFTSSLPASMLTPASAYVNENKPKEQADRPSRITSSLTAFSPLLSLEGVFP
jgi:hypothetical protein